MQQDVTRGTHRLGNHTHTLAQGRLAGHTTQLQTNPQNTHPLPRVPIRLWLVEGYLVGCVPCSTSLGSTGLDALVGQFDGRQADVRQLTDEPVRRTGREESDSLADRRRVGGQNAGLTFRVGAPL